jgi:hypothetical protein
MEAKGKRKPRYYSSVQERISAIDFVREQLRNASGKIEDHYIYRKFGVTNLIKKMGQVGYLLKEADGWLRWNPECNLSSEQIALNLYAKTRAVLPISVPEALQYKIGFSSSEKLKRVIESAMVQVRKFEIKDVPGFLANVIDGQFVISEKKQSHESENNL